MAYKHLLLLVLIVGMMPLGAQQPAYQRIESIRGQVNDAQQPQPAVASGTSGQPATQPAPATTSIADVSRQRRGATGSSSTTTGTSQPQKSVAEIAAERRVTRPVHRSLNEEEGPARRTSAKTHHRKKRRDPFKATTTAAR
jgi:hypothetical protein